MEKIIKLITRDNITLAIACFGFVLSLFNFIKDIWINRSKISVSFRSQVPVESLGNEGLRIELVIENKSRLPISISRMFLVFGDKEYEFEWLPRLFAYDKLTSENSCTEITQLRSLGLPYTIPGYGSYGGNFVVILNAINVDEIENNYSVRIQTNRKSQSFHPPAEYQPSDEKKLFFR